MVSIRSAVPSKALSMDSELAASRLESSTVRSDSVLSSRNWLAAIDVVISSARLVSVSSIRPWIACRPSMKPVVCVSRF